MMIQYYIFRSRYAFVKPWDPSRIYKKEQYMVKNGKDMDMNIAKKTYVDISNCPKTENDTYMLSFCNYGNDLKTNGNSNHIKKWFLIT